MPGTRKLGRPTAHRMAMLKGMVTFLLEKGQIETTVTRAKEVSALTDKMITLGKTNTLANKRRAIAFLKKEGVVYTDGKCVDAGCDSHNEKVLEIKLFFATSIAVFIFEGFEYHFYANECQ